MFRWTFILLQLVKAMVQHLTDISQPKAADVKLVGVAGPAPSGSHRGQLFRVCCQHRLCVPSVLQGVKPYLAWPAPSVAKIYIYNSITEIYRLQLKIVKNGFV